MFLKQSTAYTFRHGPFLDDTDGKTAETGLTISQADVRLSKAGGNFAQKNESSASSHDEIGYYIVVLDATDTNTCGELLVAVHESGALPVFKTFQVLEETIYDSLFATSAAAFDANQRVDVAKIEGSDATDQINAACDTAMSDYDAPTKAEMDSAFSTTNGKIDVVDGIVDNVVADTNELQTDWANGGRLDLIIDGILADTAVIGAAGAGLTAVPWNSAWDAEVQSECTDALNAYDPPTKTEMDSAFSTTNGKIDTVDDFLDTEVAAILADTNELQGDWANGGRLDLLIDSIISKVDVVDGICDSILVDTAEIGSAGAGLTGIPWNSSWDAEVQSECNDALVALHLDHLLSVDYDPTSKPGTATALLNELVENDSGVSRFTSNALEQGPSGSGGGDATEAKQDQIIAAVITNAAGTDVAADIIAIKAETATIVTDTNELQTDDVPGLISALNNISTADVNAQCDLSLSDYDAPTKAEMDSAFSTTDAKIDAVDDYIDTEIAAIKTVTDAIPDSGSMSSIATASALTTVSGKIDTIDTVVDANAGKLDTLVADSPGRPAKGVALAGFPFLLVASSDHVTGKTGATVTATRSLDGAAFAACANSATEVSGGIYKITLASTDLDADTVVLKFTATDADTRYVTIVTQAT